MLVGALPWDAAHAKQVPSQNGPVGCGAECFFPQRIAEHPFMFDRFGHLKGEYAPKVPLEPRTKALLRSNDWFWVVTGVHQGGGLDCSLFIRKTGPTLGVGLPAPLPAPAQRSVLPAKGSCGAGCVAASALTKARATLQGVQALQERLKEQQQELSSRLRTAEAQAERGPAPRGGRQADCRCPEPAAAAGGASLAGLATPLLGVSVLANIYFVLRRGHRGKSFVPA